MQRKDKTHKNSNSLSLYVLNKQASWTFTGIWECRWYSHPPKVFVKYENGRQILTKTISNFTRKSMIRLLKKEIPVFLSNSHYLRHIIVVCKFWETSHVNKDMSKWELVYRRSESIHFCALGCKCKKKRLTYQTVLLEAKYRVQISLAVLSARQIGEFTKIRTTKETLGWEKWGNFRGLQGGNAWRLWMNKRIILEISYFLVTSSLEEATVHDDWCHKRTVKAAINIRAVNKKNCVTWSTGTVKSLVFVRVNFRG